MKVEKIRLKNLASLEGEWELDLTGPAYSRNGIFAITGATGAGKTTMVDLILGVLKPQAGKITVDGMDIKESYRGWHDKIGYIPQTIYMLDDTIRNNIAFGKTEGIDDADIWEALKQAQLDEFVKSLRLFVCCCILVIITAE